ncbi:MAG: orotidine-5'-phosphate decarboxylase [Alphaproteobacteria bacterium]
MSSGAGRAVATDRQQKPEPNINERLIVALDVPSVVEARKLVQELDRVVCFFKVGLYLQLAEGIEKFIDDLIRDGNKIFIDYKYGDIGASMKGGVAAAARRGINFLTVQGSGELTKEVMKAALAGKGDSDLKLFFVTLLTSLDESDLRDLGRRSSVETIVLSRAKQALEIGFDGVIASGLEARAIRKLAGPDRFLIVTPGIRPAGAGLDDHKRAVTPAEAIKEGADYLVVGRPIIKDPNPRAAARQILDEMSAAFDSRP